MMGAEPAAARPVPRGWLLLVALACGLLAAWIARSDTLPAPGWLADWSAAHPDPRALSQDETATLARSLDGQRRDDALLLLVGLAAGCLVVAARPALARAAGVVAGVLAAGSVAVGLQAVGASVIGQAQGATDGTWTLGDDALFALAGPHADALRAVRARMGPDDAVLLVGTNQPLFNAAAWALFPRPIYPVLLEVPDALTADEVAAQARALAPADGPRCWLLDLGVLERGELLRPALLEVRP